MTQDSVASPAKMPLRRPELLAPAGDWECARAAVENGADAIYFGLERFNARMRAKNFTQADLPELSGDDALASLAKRLDSEADFWRAVAMRQLARAAWTERIGVTGALLLLVGGVVLAAIAAFRALFATAGGASTAMLVGVGLGVLLVASIAVGQLSARLRRGQVEAVRDALVRADLAETRLHRIALLMEMRAAAREGYVAALAELEGDVRKA